MEILPPTKVKIINIQGKGRGVVATQKIFKDEIIETCPIIILSEKEVNFIEKESEVLKYYYMIQDDLERCCLMFGYGSIYNHDLNFNAQVDYLEDSSENYLQFVAFRDIEPGEEIVYNYEFDNNNPEFLKLD